DLVLRLEVVIQAALGELERGGDIVHRCGIVSLLLKKPGGSAQNFLARFRTVFLPRIEGSFAVHHKRWYRGMVVSGYRFSVTVNSKSAAPLGVGYRKFCLSA